MTHDSPEARDIEAANFVAKMDSECWSDADEASLEAWLARSPAHPGALLRAQAAWMSLDGPNGASTIPANDAADELLEAPVTNRRKFIVGGGLAIAASVAASFYLSSAIGYETQIGEMRRVPLPDGSIVALNTSTKIDASLEDARRHIRLEKGEAWFQVAKDSSRPFVVEAGVARVRAIGTAFSVRVTEGGAQVLVTEGVVEVWAEGREHRRVRLKAGARGFVADNAAIAHDDGVSPAIDRSLSWRQGRIHLAGERLDHAVAEFNRYNVRKLVIQDDRIAGERFDGVFRTDDPEGFANTVAVSMGVPIIIGKDQVINIGVK